VPIAFMGDDVCASAALDATPLSRSAKAAVESFLNIDISFCFSGFSSQPADRRFSLRKNRANA
jgi:hypothetical protein